MGRSDQENAVEKDFMGLGRDAASCGGARKHNGSSHVRGESKHMCNVDSQYVSSQHYADAIASVKPNSLDAVQGSAASRRWLYNNRLANGRSWASAATGRPDWSNTGGRQQFCSFNSSQEQKVIEKVNDAYQIMHARGHDSTVLNSTALNCNLPASSLPDHSGPGMKVFGFVAPVLLEHASTMRVHQIRTANGRALTPRLVGGGPSTRMLPAANSIKPSSTQLTVFYAGKVNVYNDVSSIKAQEIMLMAAASDSLPLKVDMFSGSSIQMAAPPPVSGSLKNTDPLELSPIDPSTCQSDQLAIDHVGIGPLPASIPEAPQAEDSSLPGTQCPYLDDEPACPRALPQARKASLARFLESRKERVLSKSPYPVEKIFL